MFNSYAHCASSGVIMYTVSVPISLPNYTTDLEYITRDLMSETGM